MPDGITVNRAAFCIASSVSVSFRIKISSFLLEELLFLWQLKWRDRRAASEESLHPPVSFGRHYELSAAVAQDLRPVRRHMPATDRVP